MIVHPIPPVIPDEPKLLILGSFPSVKSREAAFFYGHPQNRFWRVTAAILGEEVPKTTEEKRGMLIKHGIALWDVIASCEIEGSADSSIREAVPNDLSPILGKNPEMSIHTNGKTAYDLYRKLIFPKTEKPAILLPSTSPANAAFSLEKLVRIWSETLNLSNK
ncbi:MAG: DNA-deoxyinosine glycosylase [Clostridia bacterium]|nr:DNA-deoxyinosine glycosylase [Clostridia bacterium]